MDSILPDCAKTLEVDALFEEPDGFPSLVSSGFLHLVPFLILLNCYLAPSIKFHKLWFQARALPLPVPLASKMSSFKLI